MKAESPLEQEAGRVDPLDLLSQRFSSNVLLSSLVQRLKEAHARSGSAPRRAFSGEDPTEPVAVFLAEALYCNQVSLLELRTANHVRQPAPLHLRLAESRARELEMVLVQAVQIAIDVHLKMNGVG